MLKFGHKIQIRHRLLTRLLLSHILIVSLPLFFTGNVLVDTAQESIEETILERNLEFAIRSARFIDLKLETAGDIVVNQAKNLSIYGMNKTSLELAINTIVSDFAIFNNVSVLDTSGHLIATTSFDETVPFKFSNNGKSSPDLKNILKGETFRTDVYVSEESLPLLDIAEPIKLHDEVFAILYAVVDLKAMWDIVDENVVGENGEAFIFNKDGVYIAHSDRINVYQKNKFENDEVIQRLAEKGSGSTIYKTSQNIEMVAAYAPISDYGWGAMIQQPTSEAFAPAQRMRVRVFQFMALSEILASLLAFFYTRWIVAPVKDLVSGMEQFSKGALDYRIQNVSQDEIGALAENFNEMAVRLTEYQNTLKRTERLETLGKLASVLSHEIRNPLNSMVINMQILKRELAKEIVNKERVEKFYGILASEIKRVDQLVQDFLLIARPPKLELEKVAINEIIDEVSMMQVADSLQKGVRIEREYEKIPIHANVDAAKIRQVIVNLVLNAIQAMPGGGKLKIIVKEADESAKYENKLPEKSLLISFSDTGHGIKEEHLNKIFDFYYSTKKDGSGLGLAVVQQIVEEHNGLISVKSEVDKETTFSIYLPR